MKLQINIPFSMWDYKISGVYKITFEDGSFYIGCSCHLKQRANQWELLMKKKEGIAGVTIGTDVINKIRELESAVLDIVELCHEDDLKDKESFYLDKYRDDINMLSKDDSAWKSVLQYTPDGNFVKKHYSIQGAARYIKSRSTAIQRVLEGERKSHKGMIFIYEHDYHKRRKDIIKERSKKAKTKGDWVRKKVNKYDVKGNLLATFKTKVDAAKDADCSPSSIRDCLVGRFKTTKGFIYRYA